MLFHHRAWCPKGALLFRDAAEADLLWEAVVKGFPELDTLCLMPDHLHLLLPHADESGKLARVESAFARVRNSRRGERGRVWAPHPPAEEVPRERVPQVRRYAVLNPTRKGIVDEPLRWRWSTHRDRVGLTAVRVGPLDRDPERFHAQVSNDATVAIGETPFPQAREGQVDREEIVEAVIEVCRCDSAALRRRGRPLQLPAHSWLAPFTSRVRAHAHRARGLVGSALEPGKLGGWRHGEPRELLFQATWWLGYQELSRLCDDVGIGRTQGYALLRSLQPRGAPIVTPDLAAVVRVAGDPRFRHLGPLEALPGWKPYRGRR